MNIDYEKKLMLNKTDLFISAPVMTVVLGAHDLRKKSENSVRFAVDSYYQHPDYTKKPARNDILLLKVTYCTYFRTFRSE